MILLDTLADNTIRVRGLWRTDTNDWENEATVTMTLKDEDEANVTGAVNLSLSYVAGSNGVYVGVIPKTASLQVTDDELWKLHIFAESGSRDREFIEDVQVVEGLTQ